MQSSTSVISEPEIKAPYVQLVILIIGTFMAVLDNTIVNVAIPKMEPALNANTNEIQWIITSYMLVSGIIIPMTSWLTDRLGARNLFTLSLAFFTLGSALCGMAWNLPVMIIFRIIQALGGGFLMPIANSLIYRLFPLEKRGGVMGMFGLAVMLAPAFGPVLSGYFVQYLNWRFVFYVNVPVGIIGIILAIIFLQDFQERIRSKLDVWGTFLSATGLFSLLYGFTNVSSDGWGSLSVYPFLIAGSFLLIMLVVVELLVEHPLIELHVLKDYLLTMSVIITSLVQLVMFVSLFLLPLYFENIMNYTPLKTGLFMTPASLYSAVLMVAAGLLLNRIGARPIALFGLAMTAISSYGFSFLSVNSTENQLQLLYIFRTIGTSIALMPVMTAGMNRISANLLNQASSISNTIRQVVSSLGTAVFTYYFQHQMTVHAANLASRLTPFSPQGSQLQQLIATLTTHGVSAAAAQMVALSMVKGLVDSHSFVAGINDTFMLGTILTMISLLAAIFFNDKKYQKQAGEMHMTFIE